MAKCALPPRLPAAPKEVASPGPSLSRTVTANPFSRSARAQQMPMIPAPTTMTRCSVASAPRIGTAGLPADCVSGPAEIGSRRFDAAAEIVVDHAHRAGRPGAVGPPFDVMAAFGERVPGLALDAALELKQVGAVLERRERRRKAERRKTRCFDRMLRVHPEHRQIDQALQH